MGMFEDSSTIIKPIKKEMTFYVYIKYKNMHAGDQRKNVWVNDDIFQ